MFYKCLCVQILFQEDVHINEFNMLAIKASNNTVFAFFLVYLNRWTRKQNKIISIEKMQYNYLRLPALPRSCS